MDTQDLRSHLRGLCLVAVVRHTRRPPLRAEFRSLLESRLGEDLSRFAAAAASYSGVERGDLVSAVAELYDCDEEDLKSANLNLQLSLLAGNPVPVFPFITEGGIHEVALFRPLLNTARNMIHSAVRLRMQTGATMAPAMFWPAASNFLERIIGDGMRYGRHIAVTTILNAASDIVVYNLAAPTRTHDAELAGRIRRVLDELTTLQGLETSPSADD